MGMIVLVFVGGMCVYVGVNILNATERNRVFNKRPIEVVDVKKYNRFCGTLVLGFGAVAEVTIYFLITTTGWLSSLFSVLLIVEAILVSLIYSKGEKKMLKKR